MQVRQATAPTADDSAPAADGDDDARKARVAGLVSALVVPAREALVASLADS